MIEIHKLIHRCGHFKRKITKEHHFFITTIRRLCIIFINFQRLSFFIVKPMQFFAHYPYIQKIAVFMHSRLTNDPECLSVTYYLILFNKIPKIPIIIIHFRLPCGLAWLVSVFLGPVLQPFSLRRHELSIDCGTPEKYNNCIWILFIFVTHFTWQKYSTL